MAEYICYACCNEGPGRKRKRGSGKAELIIWVALLIPGPIYSLWRRCWLKRTCIQCGMDAVVKVTSDQGQIAKRRLDMELGILPVKRQEVEKPAGGFGNERPAAKVEMKKPVDPEQF